MRAAIPPNYDSGTFKLGGLVSWRVLIEAGMTGVVTVFLGNVILPDFLSGIFREILIFGVAAFFVIITITGIGGMSPAAYALGWGRFIKNRRRLSYRKICRRIKLKDKPECRHFRKIHSTQQMVPVKKIYREMAEMKDGSFVSVLEFDAVDFVAMGAAEKRGLLAEFSAYNRVFDARLQWKKMVFPETGRAHSDFIKACMAQMDAQSGLYRLAEALAQMVSGWQRRQLLSEPCYLILSWTPPAGKSDGERAALAFEKLKVECDKAREFLGRCGNKMVAQVDTAFFLYTLYYQFFNRRSSRHESFDSRFRRVYRDFKNVWGASREPSVRQLTAPRGMDMTKRRYMVMDGLYYSFFIFTDYPQNVPAGWLNLFLRMGDGYDVDVFLNREDRAAFLSALSRQLGKKEGDIGAMPESSISTQEALEVYRWNREMQRRLLVGEEVFYFAVMVTVFANTRAELKRRKERLVDDARSKGFGGFFTTDHKEALDSATPTGKMASALFKNCRRNVLSDGAAALYPLTTAVMKNDRGVALGINRDNRTPLCIDFFDPIANMLIFGATGHGKSYLAMLISARLRITDTQIFVVAPAKGFEYRPLCEAVAGNFIALGIPGGAAVNIMEIHPQTALDGGDAVEKDRRDRNLLSEKIQQLLEFFKVLLPEIDKKTLRLLDPMLKEVYGNFGITHDNRSVYKDGDPAKGLVSMPVIGDIQKVIAQEKHRALHWLIPELDRFVSGSLTCFNRESNVDLDNKYCVLDLSALLPEVFPLGLFIAESYLWDVLRRDRIKRKTVIFEEMWKMLELPQSEAVIREIYKTIRGYRGIALGVTQELGDVLNQQSGRTIFDQSRIKAVMYMPQEGAREVQTALELSDYAYHTITHAQTGEALICTKEQNYRAKIVATAEEAYLFETDGNALERRRIFDTKKNKTV